ncbi:MAG: hypothetical protein OSA98_17335, partial [Rubripirellula sp.]|nr:hypothetical protein [Rubripirellula sp.]
MFWNEKLFKQESELMSDENRAVALVTGSATGVGRACVLQFAERGYDVRIENGLLAHAAEALAPLVGARPVVIVADENVAT